MRSSPPPPVLPTSTSSLGDGSNASDDPIDPPPGTPRPRGYRRYLDAVITWVKGPVPPREVGFEPFFPHIQAWPSETVDRLLKRRTSKWAALALYFAIWLTLFTIVVHYSRFADRVEGVVPMHLNGNSALWGRNNECGLNGEVCKAFSNNSIPFRCPSGTLGSGRVLNPRAVGATVAAYQPFVIGGPGGVDDTPRSIGTYRADSFICPSAVHAGVISNQFGGCGILNRVGERRNYPSSLRHGVTSIPFDATFPASFTFSSVYDATSCKDLRWHLFGVSVPFTTFLSIVSTSPATTFAALFTGIFFHVALASDPPFSTNPYSLVSLALARFLPAAFVAYVIWTKILRRVHCTPLLRTAAVEKTGYFLGGLWFGALTNITFDRIIPINRLTARDLAQQPGARATLAIICLILLALALGQIYYLRLSGQLPGMLGLYTVMGTALGLLSALPGNSLRIHHYILALLLLPGTRILTRPSLAYQGLLLGLFINGIARWGFASIVETPFSLMGDGLYFSAIPSFDPPPVVASTNVTVRWPTPALSQGWTGVSVLVNDVERYRWKAEEDEDGKGSFTARRYEREPLYLRLAYVMYNGQTADFTRAGVVLANGTWREPERGRT